MIHRKKRPTLAQIAEEAGVSVPTVSKVLHRPDLVAQETRSRITQVMSQHGYTVSAAPTALRKRQQGFINLVVPNLGSPYEYEIIRGVEKILSQTDVHLVLTAAHEERQLRQWLTKIGTSIDGVILVLVNEQTAHLDELRQRNIPFIVVDHLSKLDPAIPAVGVNNWAGGKAATEYLLSLGHRRIGLINGHETYAASQDRLAGYCSALTIAGLPIDPALIRHGHFKPEDGYAYAHELLDLKDRPTAIFVANDEGALGVYQVMYERGIAIPREMSVIGFDDLPLAAHLAPPLTTVRQPLLEIGKMATNMVLQLLAGEDLASPRIELPTTLMERASCAPVAHVLPHTR